MSVQPNDTARPAPPDDRRSFFSSPNYKWYIIGMLWFMAFFNYADRQAFSAVVPLIRGEMNLTPTEVGWLTAAFAWVYGLGAPFAGFIIDKIRRKTAILGGLQVWSLICMATALSKNFRQLFFWRAAEGIGETFYFPASMSLVSDYHGKKTRSRAMGLHQTSVYAGTVIGSVVAAKIGQEYGWRWSFILFGAMGCILGVVLKKLLREPERGAADRADAGVEYQQAKKMPFPQVMKLIFTTPTVFTLMGGFVFANMVALVLLGWMPTFIYDKFHYSPAMAGLSATAFIQIASMFGSPLGGFLADKLRSRTSRGRMCVQATGVILATPFVVMTAYASTFAVLVVGLLLWGFFKGIYDANIFASVYDVVPAEARGTTAGFMNCVGWFGGAAGPIVVGKIAETSSMSFAIAITSTLYLCAGAVLILGMLLFVNRDAARAQAMVQKQSGAV